MLQKGAPLTPVESQDHWTLCQQRGKRHGLAEGVGEGEVRRLIADGQARSSASGLNFGDADRDAAGNCLGNHPRHRGELFLLGWCGMSGCHSCSPVKWTERSTIEAPLWTVKSIP